MINILRKDELLDLVDSNDKIIGTVWKSEAHGDPKLIHREIAIGVFNNFGEVLLQRRSTKKSVHPGEWKITAAGHVGSGEKPLTAAKREVMEELGIKIDPVYVYKIFSRDSKDNESKFYWVFYALIHGRPRLRLDEKEVMDAKWIRPKDLVSFSKNNDFNIRSGSYKMILKLEKILKSEGLLKD